MQKFIFEKQNTKIFHLHRRKKSVKINSLSKFKEKKRVPINNKMNIKRTGRSIIVMIINLIIVIQRIYQFIYSLKNMKLDTKKRAYITSELLKYLVHLLVLERKIKIDEEPEGKAEFLKQTDILIDSCVNLLSFSKTLKTPGCLKKIFG